MFDNIVFDEFTLLESIDKSELDKDFKKKNSKSIKIFDLDSAAIKKYSDSIKDIKGLNDWRDACKDDYSRMKIAVAIDTDKNKFAGYISVLDSKKEKNIISGLYIQDEYKGYGISEKLLSEAIHKYYGDKLGVYSDNEIAIRLYKKFGFKEYDRKKKKDEEYILMKLH